MYAYCMIAVYPLGVPLFFCLLLWRARGPLHAIIQRSREQSHGEAACSDSAKAAAARLDDASSIFAGAGPAPPRHVDSGDLSRQIATLRERVVGYAWLKPIIDGYKPQYYWYEVQNCLRKLALVGLLVPIGQGSIAQLIAGSLIAATALCMLCSSMPYMFLTDNVLAIACQTTIFVTLQLALYLRLVQLDIDTQVDEARLRATDLAEEYQMVTMLEARQQQHTSRIGVALIALWATPLVLAVLCAAYETPRAWRSASERWRHERSALTRRLATLARRRMINLPIPMGRSRGSSISAASRERQGSDGSASQPPPGTWHAPNAPAPAALPGWQRWRAGGSERGPSGPSGPSGACLVPPLLHHHSNASSAGSGLYVDRRTPRPPSASLSAASNGSNGSNGSTREAPPALSSMPPRASFDGSRGNILATDRI